MGALSLSPREIARILGGDAYGGNKILAPGPGHSRKDRSLSITIKPDAPDGFLVHSQAGDDDLACKDHVRERLGLARAPARGATPRRFDPSAGGKDDDAERTSRALALWEEASG